MQRRATKLVCWKEKLNYEEKLKMRWVLMRLDGRSDRLVEAFKMINGYYDERFGGSTGGPVAPEMATSRPPLAAIVGPTPDDARPWSSGRSAETFLFSPVTG